MLSRFALHCIASFAFSKEGDGGGATDAKGTGLVVVFMGWELGWNLAEMPAGCGICSTRPQAASSEAGILPAHEQRGRTGRCGYARVRRTRSATSSSSHGTDRWHSRPATISQRQRTLAGLGWLAGSGWILPQPC